MHINIKKKVRSNVSSIGTYQKCNLLSPCLPLVGSEVNSRAGMTGVLHMSSVEEFPTDVTARSNIVTSGLRRANRVAADCPSDTEQQ